MLYQKIIFQPITTHQSEIVIALLSNEGFEGFEEKENSLFAFIRDTLFNINYIEFICKTQHVTFTQETVVNQNWNKLWEESWQPIIINNEVGVRASFHTHLNVIHEIIINPKMSFGTGHHATTQLMMEYICEQNFYNKTVLDYGCGTGILSIFAKKKKALTVLAIDNDIWAVENTKENIHTNYCNTIDVRQCELAHIHHLQFEIILANINYNIIVPSLATLHKMLLPTGIMLISGLLNSDIENFTIQLKKVGFTIISEKKLNNWSALNVKKIE